MCLDRHTTHAHVARHAARIAQALQPRATRSQCYALKSWGCADRVQFGNVDFCRSLVFSTRLLDCRSLVLGCCTDTIVYRSRLPQGWPEKRSKTCNKSPDHVLYLSCSYHTNQPEMNRFGCFSFKKSRKNFFAAPARLRGPTFQNSPDFLHFRN